MRKTRHVSCKVLAWLDTELDISSWKLVCMERKSCLGFRKMSIFHVRGICCNLLEYYFVLFKVMEAEFLSLTLLITMSPKMLCACYVHFLCTRDRPKSIFHFSAVSENADESEIPFTTENV